MSIRKISTGDGMMVNFGKGTVRIKQYMLKKRFGGQVELTTCPKTKIGEVPPKSIYFTNKVVLDFSNVESLDTLIEGLQNLRDEMKEGSNG